MHYPAGQGPDLIGCAHLTQQIQKAKGVKRVVKGGMRGRVTGKQRGELVIRACTVQRPHQPGGP